MKKYVYILMPVKVQISGDDCEVVSVECPSTLQAQNVHTLIGHYDDVQVALKSLDDQFGEKG